MILYVEIQYHIRMKEIKIIAFEWDTIHQNIYEKAYYYCGDRFIRSEIIRTYHAKDNETYDKFFRIDEIIEHS
jgi:hypothetical protein